MLCSPCPWLVGQSLVTYISLIWNSYSPATIAHTTCGTAACSWPRCQLCPPNTPNQATQLQEPKMSATSSRVDLLVHLHHIHYYHLSEMPFHILHRANSLVQVEKNHTGTNMTSETVAFRNLWENISFYKDALLLILKRPNVNKGIPRDGFQCETPGLYLIKNFSSIHLDPSRDNGFISCYRC